MAVVSSEDKEEAEALFLILVLTEGRGAAHFLAEVAPTSKGCGGGVPSLG